MESKWITLIDVECAIKERIHEQRAREMYAKTKGQLGDGCVYMETDQDANDVMDHARVSFSDSIRVVNEDGQIATVPAAESGYIAVTCACLLEQAFEEAGLVEVARVGPFSLRA